MLTLLRNGGYPPMLFILVTGAVGLAAAFHFAIKARRASLGFIKSMMLATFFGTLAASCADVGAVLFNVERAYDSTGSYDKPGELKTDGGGPHVTHMLVAGLAESTSPGILGFSFLGVTSLLVATGRRRLDAQG